MAEEQDDDDVVRPRPFWSGVIAFGLVSLPVSLFPANRPRTLSLKMVDVHGVPLKRRYFCEEEQQPLDSDDIVRGYEVEKHSYVVVEDEELEALAPEKSQEIDLRRFVAREAINPIYFERAYFLVPDQGATKAYRLLAKSMEDEQRAGIATFVMRGKEYLVAIMAERGILRAETLRFHDEIRSPEDIGLPALKKPAPASVHRMQQCMQQKLASHLDRDELADRRAQQLLERVQTKLKSGKDVVKPPEEPAAEYVEEDNVIDLMQVLKERLQGGVPETRAEPPQPAARAAQRKKSSGTLAVASRHDPGELDHSTREELYELAKELHIPGRSSMSKKQLIDAIRKR